MPPINLYELGFDKVYIKIIIREDGSNGGLLRKRKWIF